MVTQSQDASNGFPARCGRSKLRLLISFGAWKPCVAESSHVLPQTFGSEGTLRGKKIVFVFNNLDMGGAERQGLLLARHLRDVAEAQVEVWGLQGPGQIAELCDQRGVSWRVVPFRWNVSRLGLISQFFRFCGALKAAKVDVLLPYIMTPNLVCGAVWRWTGASTCIWQQRDGGIWRGPRRLEQWVLKRVPIFVANGTAGVEFLADTVGVRADRIHLIRNGVELPPPQTSRDIWRLRLGLGTGDLVACMVANLHSDKDHATLLRSWRIVIDRLAAGGRSPVLLLAGRFDDAALSLKALAFDLELAKQVRFLGPVSDISGLLQASDLGVLSSRCEGCPNAVLEYMAAGLPVAGTDIPGIREALGEQGKPWLAPVGDAAALADRILRLCGSEGLRRAYGAENILRIKNEFAPNLMCEATTLLILSSFTSRPVLI